ncbi:lipoyltransferase [Aureobasidium sp. EXF-10728]|nr:lipoyltransferase [Aureobasidium sp. EXF-10728]
MLIRHLRLKGIVPYAKAETLQQDLVKKFLAHKASPATTPAPGPTIITAQFSPVYTCGRREVGTVSEEQQTFLRDNGNADFYEALRGGQTTFHGPGQLVAYPIIDLKRHNLSPRNYVCLLEKTLIKTCAHYGIKAMTTENPGVWTTPDDKISALGVHLRRNITSHGIGLNINTDLKWFSRIVACGLEGKRTTSFENEGVHDQSVDGVADTFVHQLAESLQGIEGVQEELIIFRFSVQLSQTGLVLSVTAAPLQVHKPGASTMAFSSLKRQLSRVLARDTANDGISNRNAPGLADEAPLDGQRQRASPKTSIYMHSPAHSGATLHDPNHAPTDVSPEYPSEAVVHVMTVGDSIITIETQQRDAEEGGQPAVKRRKKSFSLRRVKTAPAVQNAPLHGSITTIESVPGGSRPRAWSYPLANWKNLSLIRRMRRSADLKEARKEARRGKARRLVPDGQPPTDDHSEQASAHLPPLMSGAVQGSPSHMDHPSNKLDVSPRASVDLGIRTSTPVQDKGSPKYRTSDSNRSSEEQTKRKDSHFHEVMQAKEKAAVDTEADTREVAFDERPQKNSAFLLHPMNWIRQHHASVFPLSSSDSSSDSDSAPPSPTSRPARPARRIQEPYPVQTQTAHGRASEAFTRDELYMRPRIHLPPGMDIPAVGQAGPADWLHRGWEEHYRQSAESSCRACHPLAAARCLPTRGEEMQRYVLKSPGQDGRECVSVQRRQPIPKELCTQTCDFAYNGKGKGTMYVEDYDTHDERKGHENRERDLAEYKRQRRIQNGACVTTLTLGECNFGKELGQSATEDTEST